MNGAGRGSASTVVVFVVVLIAVVAGVGVVTYHQQQQIGALQADVAELRGVVEAGAHGDQVPGEDGLPGPLDEP